MIKLRMAPPNPDQVQTVKLRARMPSVVNIIRRDETLEFVKVIAVDPTIREQDGLFGPYLVLAEAWRSTKSPFSLTSRVRLYYDPSHQSVQEQQIRKTATYDINITNDLVDKDCAFTTDNGYYPSRLLIPVPPAITRTSFEQAMKAIMNDPLHTTYRQEITTIGKQQEQLSAKKEKLARDQHDFAVKCATILLTGFPPTGENQTI